MRPIVTAKRSCYNATMIWQILTVIGLVVGLLDYFDVKPRKIDTVTRRLVFANKKIVTPTISSAFIMTGFAFLLTSKNVSWWSYSLGIISLLFVWLVYLIDIRSSKGKTTRSLKLAVVFMPLLMLIPLFGEIDSRLTADLSSHDRQLALITSLLRSCQ